MKIEVENRKKIVDKVLVTVIALALIIPMTALIVTGDSPEAPVEQKAPAVKDFYAGNTIISLGAATFDINEGPQNLPDELTINEYSEGVDGYYIVQFNDVTQLEWIAKLKQLGAKISSYVPYNAFAVKMSDDVKAQVENMDFVQYVGIYQPAYKMPKALWNDIPLNNNLHAEDALAFIKWENLWQKAEVIGQGPKITVSIIVHEDENPYNVAALIAKAGGTVLGISESAYSVRAEVSLLGIQVLSFLTDVEYVTPYYEAEIHLATAAPYEQAKDGSTPVWDEGIHGEGMIVATSDTGLDTDHEQFIDPGWVGADDWTGASPGHRKVVRYEQWADDNIDDSASQHGTHTAGYACGNGDAVGSGDPDRFGLAYEAKISFHDIGASDDSLSGIPQDLKDMFQIQYNDGARLSSNSWGIPCLPPATGIRTLAEGKYTEDAMNSDWFMWENKDFQIFFSAGNDRTTGPGDRGDLYPYGATVTPPATAKNIVSVGAHQSGSNWRNMEGYSSFGPTLNQDYNSDVPAEYYAAFVNGRLKPDVCSDGAVRSATGDHNRDGNEDNNYASMSGTSTSGPVCMGATTLIYQYFQDGYWPFQLVQPVAANAFTPSAALVKAALLNGARDSTSGSGANSHDYELYGHSMDYPNNDQGWGMTDIGDSLYFDGEQGGREMEIDDNQVGLITDQYREYQFRVDGGPLEITLVWTDYKGSQASQGNLVNDLDLNVTAPDGTTYYWGNNFHSTLRESDSTNPLGEHDYTNNVECVLVKIPATGMWTVNVSAAAVQAIEYGPQPYGLVMTGDFGETYGWVKMDKHVYADADTVTITVKDTDGMDATGGGSVDVTLLSTTGDKESITLNELGANSRLFQGTIPTNLLDIFEEDGFIAIENGGQLTVWYNESAPTHESMAIAATDVTGPQISEVHVTDITNTMAIVRWVTDVPATSQVYYGLTAALGSQTPLDGDMVFNHSVVVSGLTGFTNYYYDVESESIGGVTTRDNFGGDHYMFTTVDNPDVMIVQEHSDAESSEEQVADWRLSLDHFGWSYVVWETVKYGLPSVAAMNTAKCVYWDVGEGYPQLGSDERAIIQTWVNQPQKQLWYQTGQDVCWDMSDDGDDGPGTDVDNVWRQTYLHTNYERDDADGGGGNEGGTPFKIEGTAHAITSTFPGNGVQLDLEQDIYGPTRFWPDDLNNNIDGDVPPPWDYSSHAGGGNAGGIAWDGASYKIAYEAFAHAMIQEDGTFDTPGYEFGIDLNLDRATIADETLIWLFGEDHPDVHVTSPDGGEVFNGVETITWTILNAVSIDILISRDSGQSYVVEATGLPGAQTSYLWDTATSGTYGPGLDFPNGDYYRVKVIGYGLNLKGFDVSDDDFSITNGGGDDEGPIIWAGSVKPSPIPVVIGNTLHIDAVADDRYRGRSTINQVELYIDGTAPGNKIGDMSATDTIFDETLEDAEYDHTAFESAGTHTIYVRARDAYSNWGGFESIDFEVIMGTNTNPTIDITVPNGLEVWMGGSSQQITWTMSDLQDPDANLVVDLEYSTTGAGGPWTPIGTAFGVEFYDWDPVPLEDSANCYIRAVCTDTGLLTDEDLSDAAFEIDSTAPTAAPNPTCDFTGANNVEITWDPSPSGDVDHYEVWYRANTGWNPNGDSYIFRAAVGLATNYVHLNAGVNSGADYWWNIRTYDVAGHETRTIQQAAKVGSVQNAISANWHLCGSGLVRDYSLANVLQGFGLPGNYACVRTYDGLTDTWKTSINGHPHTPLTQITDVEGFWLYITATTRFAAAGYVEDKVIDLYDGWNLVAWPFATNLMTSGDIMTHLAANCPGYDGMLIGDGSTTYQLVVPTGAETLQNSMGFWVHVTVDTTWTVTNY